MKDKTAAFKNVRNVIHTVKLKYKLIGFKIIIGTLVIYLFHPKQRQYRIEHHGNQGTHWYRKYPSPK